MEGLHPFSIMVMDSEMLILLLWKHTDASDMISLLTYHMWG